MFMTVKSFAPAYLTIILCLSVSAFAADAAADAKALARKIDARYNAIRTLRMDFTEQLATAGVQKRESGVLELKKPGRMRWDYKQPQPKLFVSDGKTAYFYVPGERQARKGPVKKLDDLQSPLRYLLGRSRIADELEGLKLDGNVLSGTPKHLKDRVEKVELTISANGLIERIVIEEIDGTRTEFAFTNIQENVTIADQQFKFVPPPGIEMVETTQLQPQ
jgi:outer membrane lipoprotein carrier protein